MADPPSGRATIEDVAAAAGVSVATVSRALRGLPNVAPSTRDHVTEIAGRLAYRPDPAASRLAAGRTRTVAIAVPNLVGWYFAQVIGGAEAVLSDAGYDLLVIGVTGDDARARFLHDAQRLDRRADGLILVDLSLTDEEAAELAATDIHVVTIGFECPAISSVLLDDAAVGRDAANHLLDLGHRDIGLIEGAPGDQLRFAVPARRRQGFAEALRARGVEPYTEAIAAGNLSVEGGAEAMTQLLRLERRPTAVFAMSDEMAMGALRAAREAGLTVPDDISIIGVDDHELAHVLDLTTVGQDVAGKGSTAARWIVTDLEAARCELYRKVDICSLVIRGTKGKLRG
jgi:DNA-binding LacI/PurR family transcriptional regulator